MGEDVVDRRAFIETHAKEVTNLDIEHEDNEPTAPMVNWKTEASPKKCDVVHQLRHVRHHWRVPDARDGLKPVHRRVLYGMFEGGYTHEKKYSKSAGPWAR